MAAYNRYLSALHDKDVGNVGGTVGNPVAGGSA
jgi:hypothetical protein